MMKRDRLAQGFWVFAICRSPNGWAINLWTWIFYFGSFLEDIQYCPWCFNKVCHCDYGDDWPMESKGGDKL